MSFKRILIALAGLGLLVGAWRAYGLPGLAIVGGGLVMWILLHFTRMMHVLKQASDRPLGWVGSAVMLNAKLKRGVNLLHVMAMTKSLGERLSAEDAQPEVFRWTDNGGSTVTCEFADGRLTTWTLWRPTEAEEAADGGAGNPAAH